jgi:hypothetical protein
MQAISREKALAVADALFSSRYAGASFCIAAGSIIRGNGLPWSDLDLVVIFDSLEAAWRESFWSDGVPVEAFVHDVETIQAFLDDDFAAAHVAMIDMVATGVTIPTESDRSFALKNYAQRLLDNGPEMLNEATIDALRYSISDLVDDLRADRPIHEERSILYALYQKMGELRLRRSARFSASGKHLARSLRECDLGFAERLEGVMAQAHVHGASPDDVNELLRLLEQLGGYLFDGYHRPAPRDKRKRPAWLG